MSSRAGSPKAGNRVGRRKVGGKRIKKGKRKSLAQLPLIPTEDTVLFERLKPFWYDSLTSKPTKEELYDLPGYGVLSGRQAIGLDQYESKNVNKILQADSIAQLFQLFLVHRGRKYLRPYEDMLSKSFYCNRKKALEIMSKFERLAKHLEAGLLNLPRNPIADAMPDSRMSTVGTRPRGSPKENQLALFSDFKSKLDRKKREKERLLREQQKLEEQREREAAAAAAVEEREKTPEERAYGGDTDLVSVDKPLNSSFRVKVEGDIKMPDSIFVTQSELVGGGDDPTANAATLRASSPPRKEIPATVIENRNTNVSLQNETHASNVEGMRAPDATASLIQDYFEDCRAQGIVPCSHFVRSYETNTMKLTHFTLGAKGIKAMASALKTNRFLQNLDLQDNCLRQEGGLALAKALRGNDVIKSLDVSCNHLNTAAAIEMFHAIGTMPNLETVNLSRNDIRSTCSQALTNGLSRHRKLNYLDLGDNAIGNDGALALAVALTTSWPIKSLRLSWNDIGVVGIVSISKSIKHHHSLIHLDVSWNKVHDMGAYALGQVLARTRSLRSLDVRHNGIGPPGVMLLAEGLKLNLNSMVKIDCSHNPLGHLGVELLLRSKPECPSMKHYGLQETSVGSTEMPEMSPMLGVPDYNGYFRLNLSIPFERAVADVLHIRKHRRGGIWRHILLNNKPFEMEHFHDHFDGILSFFFIDSDTLAPKPCRPPFVHFSLDLKNKDERNLLNGLVERSYREPGTNLTNVFVDGVRRNLEQEMRESMSVEMLGKVKVELDYTSSTLYHQKSYNLDLSIGHERAVVHKLLERIFESTATKHTLERKGEEGGPGRPLHPSRALYEDRWEDAFFNGAPFSLERWAINWDSIQGSVLETDDAGHVLEKGKHDRKTSEKNAWRVPEHGKLTMKHVSAHPVVIKSTHHKFDIGVAENRVKVVNYWLRASQLRGRSLFNCMYDNKPFHFDESLWREKKMLKTLPNVGCMEFDFVVMVPQETTRRMYRSSMTFDLSNYEDREQCLALLLRQQRSKGEQIEFWMNVQLGRQELRPEVYLDEHFVIPRQGNIKFDIAYFPIHEVMRDEVFVIVLEELQQQMNESEMLLHLKYVCTTAMKENENLTGQKEQGGTSHFITCKMAATIMRSFYRAKDQWEALKVLLPLIVDPHAAREVYNTVFDTHTRRELYRWMSLESSLLVQPGDGITFPFGAKNAHAIMLPADYAGVKGKG